MRWRPMWGEQNTDYLSARAETIVRALMPLSGYKMRLTTSGEGDNARGRPVKNRCEPVNRCAAGKAHRTPLLPKGDNALQGNKAPRKPS